MGSEQDAQATSIAFYPDLSRSKRILSTEDFAKAIASQQFTWVASSSRNVAEMTPDGTRYWYVEAITADWTELTPMKPANEAVDRDLYRPRLDALLSDAKMAPIVCMLIDALSRPTSPTS